MPAKGVLGFCALLLKTCEYDAAPVFQKLLDSYRGDLSVDESLFGVSRWLVTMLFVERCSPLQFPAGGDATVFLPMFSDGWRSYQPRPFLG